MKNRERRERRERGKWGKGGKRGREKEEQGRRVTFGGIICFLGVTGERKRKETGEREREEKKNEKNLRHLVRLLCICPYRKL